MVEAGTTTIVAVKTGIVVMGTIEKVPSSNSSFTSVTAVGLELPSVKKSRTVDYLIVFLLM